MKTRSNMPIYVLEVSDIKALSNSQINQLRCGDYLVKKDASGEHAYKVTFKSATGLCLTYHDASVIETQSYDLIDGVWTYNSEDKTPNLLTALQPSDITGGTLENAKPIYIHPIVLFVTTGDVVMSGAIFIFNNNPTAIDTYAKLKTEFGRIMTAGSISSLNIVCTGKVQSSTQELIISHLYVFSSGNTISAYGLNQSGAYTGIDISALTLNVVDGVNKIN